MLLSTKNAARFVNIALELTGHDCLHSGSTLAHYVAAQQCLLDKQQGVEVAVLLLPGSDSS